MRTNSMIVVVVSCLSILIGDGNARIVAEDAPADALDPVNRTSKGNVSELMRKTKRGYALSEIRLASAPLLAEMASEHGYRLEQDQVLRRIAPPYPEVRATYYKVGHPWQAQAIPTPANGMTFYWDGEKLAQWGMTFGAAYRLTDIVDYALKIKPPDIEGTKEFLERRLEGDWVVRPGAGEEQFLKEFETILQKEFELPVRLMFAKRVRTVYVARGNYHYIPVERDANKNANEANERIEIYGSELSDPNLGGGGGGKLKDFLAWVGSWIKVSIIDEVSEPPAKEISWHDNHEEKGNSGDNHNPELVLKNIAAQTSLTFTKELRVVRRLLVEPLE